MLYQVLQSFKIMDYSLLLGIHNLDQAAKERVSAQLNSFYDYVLQTDICIPRATLKMQKILQQDKQLVLPAL